LFLEREVNPSIACNPHAESKRALRATLYAARVAAAADQALNDALAAHVVALLDRFAPGCVGFYWPLRGEFDARGLIASWLENEPMHKPVRRAALPVIRERHTALEFHAWTPNAPMREGHHRIPEPAEEARVQPDLLLIPCVGFDADGYRLGYGGGYYDRTLAAWPGDTKPVTVGIAYEACRIATGLLAREAHDLPLDAIVTDAGCHLAPAPRNTR
jgi:5,10-methenyltetrahydrofolate synthetase